MDTKQSPESGKSYSPTNLVHFCYRIAEAPTLRVDLSDPEFLTQVFELLHYECPFNTVIPMDEVDGFADAMSLIDQFSASLPEKEDASFTKRSLAELDMVAVSCRESGNRMCGILLGDPTDEEIKKFQELLDSDYSLKETYTLTPKSCGQYAILMKNELAEEEKEELHHIVTNGDGYW